MKGLAGLAVHEVSPRFLLFTLWSHCYHNLLKLKCNTCLSQPLHSAVEAGGPDGGAGSEGKNEVGLLVVCMCVCVCVCVCVVTVLCSM